MDFAAELDLFVGPPFGKPVVAGAVSGYGILDMPTQVVADGMVLTTEYKLTVRTDQFGGLRYGDAVTVDGLSYEVREPLLIDDGLLTELLLTRLEVVVKYITTLAGLRLKTLNDKQIVAL